VNTSGTLGPQSSEQRSAGHADEEPSAPEVALPALAQDEDAAALSQQRLSIGKRLLSWRTIVPLVVVIVFFALAVPHLSLELDLRSIAAALGRANIWLFVVAFLVYYCSFPVRSLRWKLLLENVGYSKKQGVRLPNFLHLNKILYLSWFANVIVPAKLGDVYRAYLLGQEAPVSATRSFGTVLAERILDLIGLLLLFISAILFTLHGQLPSELELALRVCLGLVVALIVGLVALRVWRDKIGRFVPARFRQQYTHFQEGTLGSFKRLHLLAPLTVAVWSLEAMRFMFVALAVGLLGGDPAHIFAAALFIALGESLLTTVPLTSGGVFFVEAGMFAMILLFTPQTAAAHNTTAAAVLLDRLISLLSVLVFGGLLFFFTIVLGKGLRRGAKRWKSWRASNTM
jgi:uncharacterized protein (TIRG00374 family)